MTSNVTFQAEESRFRLEALLLGAVAGAGVALGLVLEIGWQRAAAFAVLFGASYFAYMSRVFAFAARVKPILAARGGDTAPLLSWTNRWMGITFAALVAVAVLGVVEIVRAGGWLERVAIFLTVGGVVYMAAMGAIFGFCALPQVRVAPPGAAPSSGADPSAED